MFYLLVDGWESSSFDSLDFIWMIVSAEFFIKLYFSVERKFLIFMVYPIDPIDSFLVLCANVNLLVLCYLFPFFFFLVELLKLFPQFVGLLSLWISMPSFLFLVTLIGVNKMLIVFFCLFDLLLGNLLLVLVNFDFSYSQFLSILCSKILVFLFLITEKVELVLGLTDCVLNIFPTVCINGGLLDATWLTAIDFDFALGS